MTSETPPGETEGRAGVARIEAFSDGVIAIIITIMVLELHPPESGGLERLWTIWPTFLAYVLSYIYVAIYWVNHHRLFSHATRVTNNLLWSNIALLLALSFVPFSTAYLGIHRFNRDGAVLYLLTMLLPALAYTWLQSTIRLTGLQGERESRYYRRMTRKGHFATALYLAGLVLSVAVTPWLGILCAAIVALLWILPISPLDRLFGPG